MRNTLRIKVGNIHNFFMMFYCRVRPDIKFSLSVDSSYVLKIKLGHIFGKCRDVDPDPGP